MGGGYMQLSAIGAQDAYLVGNPQITFFKVVYRRHTNFALDWIQQTLSGVPAFGKLFTLNVAKAGDLLCDTFIEIDLPASSSSTTNDSSSYINWTNGVGYAILDEVRVLIGEQEIDKQNGEWLHIWNELTVKDDNNNSAYFHRLGYGTDEGEGEDSKSNFPLYAGQNLMYNQQHNLSGIPSGNTLNQKVKVMIPFKFWYCNNIGLAVPLIALPNTEMSFRIKLKNKRDLINSTSNSVAIQVNSISSIESENVKIWCQYVYLDNEERRKFSESAHEYLIEQVQISSNQTVLNNTLSNNVSIPLYFNNPVKCLFWVYHREDIINYTSDVGCRVITSNNQSSTNLGNNWFHYGCERPDNDLNDLPYDSYDKAHLKINNQARNEQQSAMFYTNIEPRLRFGHVPFTQFINIYSFALRPAEHQPSGSCNFSRLDNASLELQRTPGIAITPGYYTIYALNYNVLRIKSGNSGLAWIN